jgi:hypothetical protein
MGHIITGYANVAMQVSYAHGVFRAKLFMVLTIFLSLLKLFYFFRIFQRFSSIVTMILRVARDLTYFMVFFVLMLSIQGLMLAVSVTYDSPELESVGTLGSNYVILLRLSLANFDFGPLSQRASTPPQHYLFWTIWLFFVALSMLIFLNFIIAKVGSSYTTINEQLEAMQFRERAALVLEVEEIMPDKQKEDRTDFPDFLVIREKASVRAKSPCAACDENKV